MTLNTRQTRFCRMCELEKPLTKEFFSIDRGVLSLRCRACAAAVQRDRRKNTPDIKLIEKSLRVKNREKIKARDSVRCKRDRAKRRALQKRWRLNNPERSRHKSAEYNFQRRSRLKQKVDDEFSANDVALLIIAQKRKCWWCLKIVRGTPEMDHRIPLARGGTNSRANIVLSCKPCNRSKGARMPSEFAGMMNL